MQAPAPILLAGPTASGKSATALALARLTDGEIISVDSMQVYQGMDVGTSKPTLQDQATVPHHLIDICTLRDSFDAARFVQLATTTIRAIQARGRRPILCGGTGLYFKALLFGLGTTPAADATLRASLEQRPLPDLIDELRQRDPAAAAHIDLLNPRRVVRALEIVLLTGKPMMESRARWSTPPLYHPVHAITRPSDTLRHRIHQRVDEMFRNGWVEETRRLLDLGLRENRAALQAIGYKQILEHLDGHASLTGTIEQIRNQTWQYARRQRTWLRTQLPTNPLEVAETETPETTARRLLALSQTGGG